MKTNKFLLFAAVIALLLDATFYASYLNLSIVDNSQFTAIVNNVNFNQTSSIFELNDLPGGTHYVKVMKPSSTGTTWNTVIFEGNINIPDNCNVYASLNESGNFMIYKKMYGYKITPAQHDNKCNCDCEACRNCKYNHPDKEIGNNEYYPRIMNSRDFADFKKLIGDRTFETTKYEMTKSVIDNNLFSTEQVREILSWFTFETNKLDLAKYAFKNTVDRNNYFKLFDIFVFESNVTELDSYIKNFR